MKTCRRIPDPFKLSGHGKIEINGNKDLEKDPWFFWDKQWLRFEEFN
jgi:hypothetical protein